MAQDLVNTAWLAERLGEPTIRVIDVRGHVLPASAPPPHYYAHRAEYEQSHIPGAVFVDWTTDIVQPGSISQDIADPALFAEVMGRLGVGAETHVIAYDDADSMLLRGCGGRCATMAMSASRCWMAGGKSGLPRGGLCRRSR